MLTDEIRRAIRRTGGDYAAMADYLALPRVLVLEAVLALGLRAEVDRARRAVVIAKELDR